jgi:hypothetical protein
VGATKIPSVTIGDQYDPAISGDASVLAKWSKSRDAVVLSELCEID